MILIAISIGLRAGLTSGSSILPTVLSLIRFKEAVLDTEGYKYVAQDGTTADIPYDQDREIFLYNGSEFKTYFDPSAKITYYCDETANPTYQWQYSEL